MTDNEQQAKDKTLKASQQLYSSEQLDQLLAIAQPKHWGIVGTTLFLLAVLILWSFLGRIPIEVQGRAVALGPQGMLTVFSRTSGSVANLFIHENQTLAAGAPIATIHNPQMGGFLRSIEKAKVRIHNIETELKILRKSLETRTQLYKEGLIAQSLLDDFTARLIDKEIDLSTAHASLATLFSDLEKASSSLPEDFTSIENRIMEASIPMEIDSLETELSTVKSPQPGMVLEVLVKKNEIIDVKTPLVWMEYPKNAEEGSLLFYTYVPVQMGNKIKPGMSVQIEPTTVNVQEYGSLLGKVKSVSPFTLSEQELISTLGNRQLVKYLTEDLSSVSQVIVEGNPNPETPSGFAWTSKAGPPFKIPSGSVCIVKVVVEEQPPISYLIPLWKLKPF